MTHDNRVFGGGSRLVIWLQALVLLLLIGPQWLVTRDLFDGSTVALAAALNNPDGLYFWFMNSNWLLAVWLFKLCFGVAGLLGMDYLPVVKLAVTGMLLGLYFEFVSLGRRLFDLPDQEARLVGLLCLASPSLYVTVNSGAVPILLCVWLVFLGHRLFWHPHVAVRLAGLAVLSASFQLNSNLVFALALDVVYLYRFSQMRWERLKWFVLMFVVALSVYATMRMLAPPRQIFADYNQILNPFRGEDLRRMVRATVIFLTWGLIPLSALAVVALAAAVWRGGSESRGEGGAPAQVRAEGWFAILAAGFLCAAAAFPYVVVGKGPPLFTYVGYGEGLTEQVLRASHGGPFAPTWANTSARHGLLFAVPLALLTWFLVGALLRLMRGVSSRWSATGLFFLMTPLFLVWVLPAYMNKLDMQHAENSLVKGFKALPPAPAGVVDLRYGPVSDWLIWSNSASIVLRQAWGRSDYYAMFHSLDVYRDDLQWQYHAYIRATGGLDSMLIQHSMAMDHFPGERCISTYEAVLPSRNFLSTLDWALRPDTTPAAQVRFKASSCVDGRIMPNPYPDKKLIP